MNLLQKSVIAAKYAYFNPDTIKKLWIKKCPIFHDVYYAPVYHTNRESGADAYSWIDDNDRTLYISFRGTKNINDLIVNLDLRQSKYLKNDMKVHTGYLRQFQSIESSLLNEIDLSIGKQRIDRIHCIGHSLGAGIASICSINETAIPTSLYTFGSPRIGNDIFASYVKDHVCDHIRVKHVYDPITNIPMKGRFKHIDGKCISILPDNSIEETQNDNINNFKTYYHLRYHACDHYIYSLIFHNHK